MKEFWLILKMNLIGLLVAVIGYPVIHELGHVFAFALFGGEIVGFTVFPVPSVMVSFDTVNKWYIVVSSISGLLFPLIISLFIRSKNLYINFAISIFKMVIVFSFIISSIVALLYTLGKNIEGDDVTHLINITKEPFLIMILMMLFSVLSILQLYENTPATAINNILAA